ncbi:MAG: hypothetical protein UR98_C0001G0036 [Parcubacteria group bacterium GW2011_GWA1_36_12]|nr:MAG: hypothetical protein UR98_C0001G0036 [Parcubacteria group bacterium GW2011_GWA1_36_12]
MKIYTKSGDRGQTSLFGGQKVAKDNLRIETYGSVDELNSLIGVIVAELNQGNSPQGRIISKLTRNQEELFVLGSDLATPLDVKVKVPRISKYYISRLEKEIDAWQKNLPELKKFILPGGSKIGAKLHLARTIARRAERSIVRLASKEKINERDIIYINRLSDWFFVVARYVNKLEKVKEIEWKGRG